MLKDEVLYILEQKRDTLISGGQLARALGVSRTAIWKAIHLLQEEGNIIITLANKGYKLAGNNDTLLEKAIQDNLQTSFVGKSITLLPSLHSTNQYLRETDTSKKPHGYVVIANEQTKGQGRRGREFLSPKNEGIYLSILLKLSEEENDIRLFTLCTAVAVSKAIEETCGLRADIKWVNDIFCNGKKVCGILTEGTLSGELQELTTLIVGIGVNVGRIPTTINNIATSIEQETGMCGIRNQLAAAILNRFEESYLDLTKRNRKQALINYYKERLFITGQYVTVVDRDESYEASVLGITESGALIVKDKQGLTRHLSSEEIKLERNK